MANGSRHGLRIIREVTRGTTPATPAFTPVRHTGTTLGLSKEALQSGELRTDRMIADVRHGARSIAGDINVEMSFSSFDEILEALLGGTWAVDTPAVGTDRLKAGVVRRYHTIEREFADIASGDKFLRFTGCEFNTMEMRVNANAMITATFGVVGKDMISDDEIITGATYGTATTTSPLDSFTGTILEGGSPIAVVTELTLNVNNGLEPRFVVGDKTSIDPSIGRSNVTANITAFFENFTMLNKFINETESSMEFTLPDAAGNEQRWVLPRIKYMGGQPDVEGEGPITLSMPVQALRDPTTETNIYIDRTPA